MISHRVAKGEWIGSIAAKHGYKEWDPVWSDPSNAYLRSKRDPNLLVEGDIVKVPDVQAKDDPAATETRSRYKLERKEDKFILRFKEVQPYIDLFGPIPYELTVGANQAKGQITADDQQIEVPLTIDRESGTLTLAGEEHQLLIGALDPIERTAGMQARLINTSWDPGPVDNDLGPLTARGTRGFQDHYKIKVDGVIGPQTRGKMKEVYGC